VSCKIGYKRSAGSAPASGKAQQFLSDRVLVADVNDDSYNQYVHGVKQRYVVT
jgi:hypothetical protein